MPQPHHFAASPQEVGVDPEKIYLGFGRPSSDDAFGHLGVGGQIGWHDPRTGLSFGFCTHGVERDRIQMGRRIAALSSRAAACAP